MTLLDWGVHGYGLVWALSNSRCSLLVFLSLVPSCFLCFLFGSSRTAWHLFVRALPNSSIRIHCILFAKCESQLGFLLKLSSSAKFCLSPGSWFSPNPPLANLPLRGQLISRSLCLQGTRGSFNHFPKNALLSFCRNMKSAVHVSYAGWLILPCFALLAHTISRIFCHQSKCSAARPSPCFDTIPHIVACVCSHLCRHLCTTFHIVAWVCSFVSKHQ